jgi:purine-nucleoside phosphorylase
MCVANWARSLPSVALILGSGLGDLANQITEERRVIQYSAIPHFRQSKVHGHSNCLVAGKLNGVNVIVQQGRFHAYEGIAMHELVFPLRVLFLLGAHTLIVTNAAGGVNKAFQPGNLMLITDHVNFMGENPLTGDNIDSLGPRFCDMSFAYAKQLQEVARVAAKKLSIELREGVYFAMKGPSYETPAEIRMIRTLRRRRRRHVDRARGHCRQPHGHARARHQLHHEHGGRHSRQGARSRRGDRDVESRQARLSGAHHRLLARTRHGKPPLTAAAAASVNTLKVENRCKRTMQSLWLESCTTASFL